jgi:hypothetical protein
MELSPGNEYLAIGGLYGTVEVFLADELCLGRVYKVASYRPNNACVKDMVFLGQPQSLQLAHINKELNSSEIVIFCLKDMVILVKEKLPTIGSPDFCSMVYKANQGVIAITSKNQNSLIEYNVRIQTN